MDCKYCSQQCGRSGRQKNGLQCFYCRFCKKYQQKEYLYQACGGTTNEMIKLLVCESVGVRADFMDGMGLSRTAEKQSKKELRC
jgi:hypothetical protein